MLLERIILVPFCSILVIGDITNSAEIISLDYIGCYVDSTSSTRALDGGRSADKTSMTLQLCLAYCQTNSLTTFFGTQYSVECFCGESYDKYGKAPESECFRNCAGNSSQKCGGDLRNSVYAVCSRGRFGAQCEKQCHCQDAGLCLRNGTCLNTTCAVEWQGPTCSDDVNECLSKQTNLCEQNCHNKVNGYNCSCNTGYQLSSDGFRCSDVNECASGNTNLCQQICYNHISGYSCSCDTGYVLASDGRKCSVDIMWAIEKSVMPWRNACIALVTTLGILIIAVVIASAIYYHRSNSTTEGKLGNCKEIKDSKNMEAVYVNEASSTKGEVVRDAEKAKSSHDDRNKVYEVLNRSNNTKKGDTEHYTDLIRYSKET